MNALRGALFAGAAVLAIAGAVAAGTFRIYEPRFRTAEQLAPLVAPLLGPDGAALPDPQGGKLILQGEPEAIAQALEALRSLDGALHQYRIESETRSRESLDRAFAGAGGWVGGNGLRIGRVAAGAGSGERTRRLGASVLVLEGNEAEIWTGTSVPVNWGGGVALVPAQSGFRVRPRALGTGEIELEITPVLAERGAGGEIRETGASTQVRVRPGEAVAIAGVDDAGESRGASLPPRVHASASSGDSAIVVRVTPLDEVPASPSAD